MSLWDDISVSASKLHTVPRWTLGTSVPSKENGGLMSSTLQQSHIPTCVSCHHSHPGPLSSAAANRICQADCLRTSKVG